MGYQPKILAACTAGGAGDLLAALPAMCALRRHFSTPLDLLTTPYAAPLLQGHPALSEIAVDDGREPLRGLAGRLAARGYSHAVVFWSNPRIAAAVQRARVPMRVGQDRRLYSFRYTHRVRVRSEAGDTSSHWTDIQMDYARALGARPEPSDYRIELHLTPADENEADEVLSRTIGERPFVILHAARGITSLASRWPSANFARLGDALAAAFSAPVALTGSRDESGLAQKTLAAMRAPAVNLCGQTTLRGFGALSTRASVVVALDSGPMHIAAAVGSPTVGIFALRTDLPNRWRPLGPKVAVVTGEYPCPRFCRKETCKTFACYAALPVEKVVAAATSLHETARVAASP